MNICDFFVTFIYLFQNSLLAVYMPMLDVYHASVTSPMRTLFMMTVSEERKRHNTLGGLLRFIDQAIAAFCWPVK